MDKSKKILITGGAGFIGSHLSEALLARGHFVTIIDDLSTGRFENIEHLVENSRFRFAIDSITNQVVMDRLVSECELIFHLAAAVGVMLIVESPVHTIETNVMGTEAVLKAALRYRARVIVASTSEVYGKGGQRPFNEEDDVILGPTSRSRWAYAASKMLDEFLTIAYHREKGLPVVILRLFNTVGPRQTGRYGMVIPRFVKQAINGDPITVFGDGLQTRCFLHVRDAVSAMIALSECDLALGHVFNVGSTEEVQILELGKKILQHVEMLGDFSEQIANEEKLKFIPYEEAYAIGFEDMRQRVPDISKIQQFTEWVPSMDLEETLMDVVAYERAQTGLQE